MVYLAYLRCQMGLYLGFRLPDKRDCSIGGKYLRTSLLWIFELSSKLIALLRQGHRETLFVAFGDGCDIDRGFCV